MTYCDPKTKRIYKALNIGRRKFQAYLEYIGVWRPSEGGNDYLIRPRQVTLPSEPILTSPTAMVTTANITATGSTTSNKKYNLRPWTTTTTTSLMEDVRHEWRELWKDRRLITDRTEFLAIYQSDSASTSTSTSGSRTNHPSSPQHSNRRRRGGFADLLHLYTERLQAIIQDEEEEDDDTLTERNLFFLHRNHVQFNNNNNNNNINNKNHKNEDHDDTVTVLEWLYESYGIENTTQLKANHFYRLSVEEQLERLQHFADWFRRVLPYYYDRCAACGVSYKDETAAAVTAAATNATPESDKKATTTTENNAKDENRNRNENDESEDDKNDKGTFLGYIYPNDTELTGKASRTELYHCHVCRAFTRFPRYNAAKAIIRNKRGRCGEYSTLLYRILRCLGLPCRWVVDWADHVWAEVLVHDDIATNNIPRWVHIDPCEAAVDNNLLYQEWGKKQTYVIALYAPMKPRRSQDTSLSVFFGGDGEKYFDTPLIQDVTKNYTTDSWEAIYQRRDESKEEVEQTINKAIQELNDNFSSLGAKKK